MSKYLIMVNYGSYEGWSIYKEYDTAYEAFTAKDTDTWLKNFEVMVLYKIDQENEFKLTQT